MRLSSSGLDRYHPIARCSTHCTLKKIVLDDAGGLQTMIECPNIQKSAIRNHYDIRTQPTKVKVVGTFHVPST